LDRRERERREESARRSWGLLAKLPDGPGTPEPSPEEIQKILDEADEQLRQEIASGRYVPEDDREQ
jgi:hypothetical protein